MDKFWRRFRRNKLALTGLCILVLFILSAIFAPLLAPHDPNRANLRNRNKPPSREHPFGTDDMGRDILSRLLYGGRISLSVGISLIIGLSRAGGAIDTVIMRLAIFSTARS